MDERTIRLLEFDELRRRVADRALSEEAAALIRGEDPRLDSGEFEALRALVSPILERLKGGDGETRESLPSIGNILPKLGVDGTVLELDEAYALMIFIERGAALVSWLRGGQGARSPADTAADMAGEEGGLSRFLLSLPDCGGVSREISRLVDREGRLRDLPELREIRGRIRRLQDELLHAGERYGAVEETRRMLQSPLPSQRDGRMVLAVKANFRGRIPGIIHEVSSTGQTIFVEPPEVVEKNNELLLEERRLEAEIRRLFRDLTARLAARRGEIGEYGEKILRLETLRARARYGHETGGVFALTGELALNKARHPFLGSGAVPLDMGMEDARTLIITGPNTGGKTVALKTIGLLALMNQFGLPIPAAEGSSLPFFDGVYADIGDEQSISQSLSTFSGHMKAIAGFLGAATEKSLVLLDELGSGTDPEEGSAIAMAILDRFIERGTRLILTTHHGILKNYGYTREGVENASMEFDGRTLSPTYRVVMGVPGESHALEVAGNNGLDGELVDRARSYLDQERGDVSALIRGLREKHRELDRAAREGEEERRRLREERRRNDLAGLQLRQKELALKREGMGSLRRLLEESRKGLENLVREIREGELNRDKTRRVKEFLRDLEQRAAEEEGILEREEAELSEARRAAGEEKPGGAEDPGGRPEPVLGPGAGVLAGAGRRPGRVLRPDKKKSSPGSPAWIVEVGSVRLSFPEKDLVPLPEAGKKAVTVTADLVSSPEALPEINLRGLRLGEALEILERQIDGAVLSGLKNFSVIHGKGEGVLRKAVHDYLGASPVVGDYYFSRPELGGFGRTEVVLK
jgi:DNA mismatch repair protein MutS2